jgi:hypothetical protein
LRSNLGLALLGAIKITLQFAVVISALAWAPLLGTSLWRTEHGDIAKHRPGLFGGGVFVGLFNLEKF